MYPARVRFGEMSRWEALAKAPGDFAGGRKVLEFVRDSRIYT
jgi:hypothetical protein